MSTRRCTARSRHLAKPRTAPGSRVSHGMGSSPRASRTGSWESSPRRSRLQATGRRRAARVHSCSSRRRADTESRSWSRSRSASSRTPCGGSCRRSSTATARDRTRRRSRSARATPAARSSMSHWLSPRCSSRRDGGAGAPAWRSVGHRACARVSGRSLARRPRRAGVHRSGALQRVPRVHAEVRGELEGRGDVGGRAAVAAARELARAVSRASSSSGSSGGFS